MNFAFLAWLKILDRFSIGFAGCYLLLRFVSNDWSDRIAFVTMAVISTVQIIEAIVVITRIHARRVTKSTILQHEATGPSGQRGQHLHNKLGNCIGEAKKRMYRRLKAGGDLETVVAQFFCELSEAFDRTVKIVKAKGASS